MNDGRIAVAISWPVSEKKLAPATPTGAEPRRVGVDVRTRHRLAGNVAGRWVVLFGRHDIPPSTVFSDAWWYSRAPAMGLAAGWSILEALRSS